MTDLLFDGVRAFTKGSPNMNSLVGFGSVAAFIISTVSSLCMHYFRNDLSISLWKFSLTFSTLCCRFHWWTPTLNGMHPFLMNRWHFHFSLCILLLLTNWTVCYCFGLSTHIYVLMKHLIILLKLNFHWFFLIIREACDCSKISKISFAYHNKYPWKVNAIVNGNGLPSWSHMF